MDTINVDEVGETTAESRLDRESQEYAEKQEILNQLRQQLAKDPRNVKLLNDVGLAAEQVGDYDRARWAYKRAIRLEPDYQPSYQNLDLLYRNEDREGLAMEALEKHIQSSGKAVRHSATKTSARREDQWQEPDEARSLTDTPIYARLNQVWDEMGLTPAEAMMLMDLENSDGLQMMQYTLLDLVARGVLEADSRLRISRGEGYDRGNLAPHEELFAKYFSRISDYVDVDKLARAALAELDDDGGVYKAAYVRASLFQKGYLETTTKRIAGFLPVQQTVLSGKGAMARNRLRRLLDEADRQLARSLASNPEQASVYVDQGGPGLLLMDGYPAENFPRWHDMLTRMGFGPAIERLRGKARKSELGTTLDDILKVLLGER